MCWSLWGPPGSDSACRARRLRRMAHVPFSFTFNTPGLGTRADLSSLHQPGKSATMATREEVAWSPRGMHSTLDFVWRPLPFATQSATWWRCSVDRPLPSVLPSSLPKPSRGLQMGPPAMRRFLSRNPEEHPRQPVFVPSSVARPVLTLAFSRSEKNQARTPAPLRRENLLGVRVGTA